MEGRGGGDTHGEHGAAMSDVLQVSGGNGKCDWAWRLLGLRRACAVRWERAPLRR